MLYGLLLTLFILIGIFIIFLVLAQPSKSSLGIGAMSGESQMLFGGSGGQNFFQKATWTLGALFMTLSLVLALMKSSLFETRYLKQLGSSKTAVVQQVPEQDDLAKALAEEKATTEALGTQVAK